MPKKSYRWCKYFLTVVVYLVFPVKTTLAHDAPAIKPVRLDFDATQAPKNCNDQPTFKAILANWVSREALPGEADRRLVVRIRRSPTGGKLTDVTLIDTTGATLAEDHNKFAVATECHKVLWEAAHTAAKLMGAFDKPQIPEPVPCPVCPSPPAPEPMRSPPIVFMPPPKSPDRPAVRKTEIAEAASRRAFVGAGVFLGTGIGPDAAIGPQMVFGFVPSHHSPRMQIEIGGAWTWQALPQSNAVASLPVQVVPIWGSLCYSRYVFRICSGLTPAFFQAKRKDLAPGNDDMRMTLAGHVRLGTEFEIAGPFSIRVDAYAQVRFWERTFGSALATLDGQSPFGLGAAAIGVWSFE